MRVRVAPAQHIIPGGVVAADPPNTMMTGLMLLPWCAPGDAQRDMAIVLSLLKVIILFCLFDMYALSSMAFLYIYIYLFTV